ncbi:MAG TPA: alkaline phosphatase family protein [Spirochaetia bacterium]|nr:alkaline phosphatase family protein [Spirochaetia bacterium]
MKKLEIVRQWMAEGKILHPLERNPNIVDLMRTMMILCGYREFKDTHWVKVLKQGLMGDVRRMRPCDHYVFVLIDGMGNNLSDFFPRGGFFDTYYVRELRSVFPSTTACALTSLITGEWPGIHGLTGWFTYLPEIGKTAKILPFVDRMNDAPLESCGADLSSLMPVKSRLSALDREVCAVLPNTLRGSAYSTWAHGENQVIGYRSLSGGFQAVAANVQNRSLPSFTFLYVPDVDTAQHEAGTSGAKVKRLVRAIDEALVKLKEAMPDNARLVVSADHGLVDVPENRRLHIHDGHPMLNYLEFVPSGEPATPIFHVREGQEHQFEDYFDTSFGSVMELLSISDGEALGLFGPDGISPVTRRRLGNYVGISADPFVMLYEAPGTEPLNHIAFHGGLQPQTMRVPLFVA